MISYLRGQITQVYKDYLVLEVNNIGYQVYVPERFLEEAEPSHEMRVIYTHLNHKEDGMTLYGFETAEEREMFLLLNSVSGVGPKAGMSILSTLEIPEIVSAILSDNDLLLSRAKGIGKKTAQRIALEIKEKIRQWKEELPERSEKSGLLQEVEMSLMALGYNSKEVRAALDASVKEVQGQDYEKILRFALEFLSK